MRTSIEYRNLQGDPITLDYENIHHRNETLSGVADPWLLARFGSRAGKWGYDLRAGLTLPLGKTQEDPFRAAEEGRSHEHIQFGTGTVNPVLGFGLRRAAGSVALDAWGVSYLVLYESSKGYEAGNRYAGGFGATFHRPQRSWWLRAGVEAQEEEAEHWNGIVHRSDGNQGRRDIFVGATGSRKISEDWSFIGTLKVPVYTHVVGGQLDYPAVIELGLSRSFGLHEHEEEESGDAGIAPQAPETRPSQETPGTKRDLAIAVSAGEEAELAPVPGKVTVFDFWAEWCLPCRDLERRLTELLDVYPALAVRKVNVVDWDTPIARRYLSDVRALPYVLVFGPDGKLRFNRTGDPEGITEAIRELLSAPN